MLDSEVRVERFTLSSRVEVGGVGAKPRHLAGRVGTKAFGPNR